MKKVIKSFYGENIQENKDYGRIIIDQHVQIRETVCIRGAYLCVENPKGGREVYTRGYIRGKSKGLCRYDLWRGYQNGIGWAEKLFLVKLRTRWIC